MFRTVFHSALRLSLLFYSISPSLSFTEGLNWTSAVEACGDNEREQKKITSLHEWPPVVWKWQCFQPPCPLRRAECRQLMSLLPGRLQWMFWARNAVLTTVFRIELFSSILGGHHTHTHTVGTRWVSSPLWILRRRRCSLSRYLK